VRFIRYPFQISDVASHAGDIDEMKRNGTLLFFNYPLKGITKIIPGGTYTDISYNKLLLLAYFRPKKQEGSGSTLNILRNLNMLWIFLWFFCY